MSKRKIVLHKEDYRKSLEFDFPAGMVVFLVALPLCLGIALASDAPMIGGLIAGIVGGLIVPIFSKAQLSVSGPAAGLTAVVISGIASMGSYEAFLVAVVIAGGLQILIGFARVGYLAYFFPSSVIKGMLSAIGIILVFKQFPHAVGYDIEVFGYENFADETLDNMLPMFIASLEHIEWGALIISVWSIGLMIFWDKHPTLRKIHWIPSALVVVVLSVGFNAALGVFFPGLMLGESHLVSIPLFSSISELRNSLSLPDWSVLWRKETWIMAVTIAMIASVESLLTIEAIDKLDPFKRKSPLDRELKAQGIGNVLSGLIGGLPITSVVVRSSAGINAGAKTKMASIVHGLFLMVSVLFLGHFIKLVPLASLASILLIVGFKLAKPSVFMGMYERGLDQFAPFMITIIVTLVFNLLTGIVVGLVAGVFFIIRADFHSPVTFTQMNNNYLLKFNKDISFFNKALINEMLESIEENSNLLVNGKNAQFIDYDIVELLEEFKKEAELKNISVEFVNMQRVRFSKLSFNVFENKE